MIFSQIFINSWTKLSVLLKAKYACHLFECVVRNKSVDTFPIFPFSEEPSEDIKFYQYERNEDNHTEKTLSYSDSGEVFGEVW